MVLQGTKNLKEFIIFRTYTPFETRVEMLKIALRVPQMAPKKTTIDDVLLLFFI